MGPSIIRVNEDRDGLSWIPQSLAAAVFWPDGHRAGWISTGLRGEGMLVVLLASGAPASAGLLP